MQQVVRHGPAGTIPRGAATAALSAACCLALCVSGPAAAQQRGNAQAQQSIGERVFSRGLPPLGRYAATTGEVFTLDRTGPRPLMRFEGRPETLVLRAQAAPGGGVVYRTDTGRQVLRVSREGGLTLYTEANTAGTPVFSFGRAEPLVAPLVTAAQLWRHLLNQSVLAGRAVQRSVFMLAPDISQGSEAVVADAATVSVDALIRMSRSDQMRAAAGRVRRIQIVEGARPNAAFADGTLTVTVQPSAGTAGRPSSERIMRAIAGR